MGERTRLAAPGSTAGVHKAVDAASVVRDGMRSGGSPLPPSTRAKMEARFGHDFSQVRVYSDSQAGRSAQQLAAKAYTVGSDVVFQPDEYSPQSLDGEELLAHELTHVVQQEDAGAGAASLADLEISEPGDASEREADEVAKGVTDKGTAVMDADIG